MIRPVTYTYKGRPLAPYGNRKTARSQRRGRRIRSAIVTGCFVILLFAVTVALVFWMASCFHSDPAPAKAPEDKPVSSATEKSPAVTEPVPEPESQVPASSSSVKAQKKEKTVTETARLSESADRQALQIYSAATSAYQNKDYESARKALRLLFEKIQLPPGHPLYDRACTMLSDASLAVYRTGSDPLDWKIHKVERGENLSRIAHKYGTDVQTITEVNELSGSTLRIGQTLRIPQGSWRIRIERKNKRLLLDSNGRLFKIYPISVGPRGESAATGLYRIRRQQTPAQILFQSAASPGSMAVIQSKENEPNDGRACFVMEQKDVAELLLLVPEKTPAEILK